jgi:hypothetical protein
VVKLIRAIERAGDSELIINDGTNRTIEEAYLSKRWRILGVLPGSSSNQIVFVLQQGG